jgi:hypothetical protein
MAAIEPLPVLPTRWLKEGLKILLVAFSVPFNSMLRGRRRNYSID